MQRKSKKKRVFWDIFPSYIIIIFVSVMAVGWFSTVTIRSFALENFNRDLEARTHFISTLVTSYIERGLFYQDSLDNLSGVTQTRITIIDTAGRVMYDSDEDISLMDNHRYRPEVLEAFESGKGKAIRFSRTLKKDMVYQAYYPANSEYFYRAAMPMISVESTIAMSTHRIITMGFFVLLFSIFVAMKISRRITDPLAQLRYRAKRIVDGNLSEVLPDYSWYEMSSLSESMNEMASQLLNRINVAYEQKKELEAVFGSMDAGVVSIDKEGFVSKYNKSFLRIFEMTSEEVHLRKLNHILRNRSVELLMQTIHESGVPEEADVEFLRANRSQVVHIRGTLLKDQSGAEMGQLLVINDVTKIRELESMRSQFVSNVSHELRTPITSIQGYIETLLNGAINDEKARDKFLMIIQKQAERLGAIIEDLLLISRVEKNEDDDLLTNEESLSTVVDSAIQYARIEGNKKSATITNKVSTDIIVNINYNLFEQAVINLVGNAVKYSEPGKEVVVSAQKNKGFILLQIQDQGYGIPSNHLPHLFERFYRVDKARSRSEGGTGLGLSIVKHIVKIHGGTIDVSSELGVGSCFTVSLPVS